MSLRWRLAIVFAAVVAVTVAAVAIAVYVSAERGLRGEVNEFLVGRARDLAGREAPPPGGEPDVRTRPDEDRLAGEYDAVTQLLDASGNVSLSFAGNPALPVDDHDRALAFAPGPPSLRDVHVDGGHYRMITASRSGGGAVQVARDLAETDEALAGLRGRMTLIGIIGALVAAFAGWLVARHTTRPVEQLAATAEHVAATEDLTAPIEVERGDEVGRLAASFNSMLASLDDSRRQQHRLVQDASHELRTPLTSLRTNIELLMRSEAAGLAVEDRHRLLADLRTELEELGDLVAELVELATDPRGSEEPVVDVDLAALAEQVVERARRRTGREVLLDATASPVRGRAGLLDRALWNLVDNADKFSPAGRPIEVLVTDGRVEVRDHGPGISPEDRARVFERFYRSTEARSRRGSGLGLSIVGQVVDAHGGAVFVEDAPGGGAVVGFTVAGG